MPMIPLQFVLIYIFHHAQTGDAKRGFGPGDQEWDYATVRPSAHMFWWLYYVNPPLNKSTEFDVLKKPLLIWLQGGPGGSSTGLGNFNELGPLDDEQRPRNYTWVNDYNVLFIDNPVGSGFSYVESPSALATNNQQIADDLVECMKQFLTKLPEFKTVPIYIIGQSYGGKMAAEFALRLFNAQKDGVIESNLKGVAMGSSWISPIESLRSWPSFLLNTGMIDSTGYNTIHEALLKTAQSVVEKNWSSALYDFLKMTLTTLDVTENAIDYYNILEKIKFHRAPSLNNVMSRVESNDEEVRLDGLMNKKVKISLGLNVTWHLYSVAVHAELFKEIMKPATDIVEQLLNDTTLQVVVFNGQLDMIVPIRGTLVWVENLKWKDAEKWKNSTRHLLIVDGIAEGFIKEYANFAMYWINRAGHMIPRDNPRAMSAVLKHLTVGAFD